MSVRYKFKDDKRWKTIAFDSAVISVLDLKRAIVQQTCELQPDEDTNTNMIFTNAQTGERYVAENFLIPKNTSVDVRKVPGSAEVIARLHEPPVVTILSQTRMAPVPHNPNPEAAPGADDEMRRLEEVLNQSSYATGVRHTRPGLLADLASAFEAPAPALAASLAGPGAHIKRPQFARTGRPRPGYICHRCQTPGHFIQDCPTNGNTEFNFQRPKPGTGIPLSMLKPVQSGQGAYRLEDGTFANIEPNHRAFAEAFSAHDRAEQKIAMDRAMTSAEDLTCQICKKLYEDPTVTSCCYTSFCHSCILASSTCPVCQEPITDVDDLSRNTALSQRVQEFVKSQVLIQSTTAALAPPHQLEPPPQQQAPIPIFQSTPRYHLRRQAPAIPAAANQEPIVRPVEVKQRHIIEESSQAVFPTRRNIDNDTQEKGKRQLEEEQRCIDEDRTREEQRHRDEERRREEQQRCIDEDRRREEERRRGEVRRRKEDELRQYAERRRFEEYRRVEERRREDERRRFDERRRLDERQFELERRHLDMDRRRELDARRRHNHREPRARDGRFSRGRSRSPAVRRHVQEARNRR